MYDKQHTLVDRREMLRVKVKSLAEEARIIRHEEERALHRKPRTFRGRTVMVGQSNTLYLELRAHRRGILRYEARHASIALALVRGRTYEQIEPKATSAPDWSKIKAMVAKYGPKGMAETIGDKGVVKTPPKPTVKVTA